MDFSGILVLVLRGLLAVAWFAFVGFSLSLLWKDLQGEKPKKKLHKKENPSFLDSINHVKSIGDEQ
jgi:predicted tellurium resistance membrane protein TerC